MILVRIQCQPNINGIFFNFKYQEMNYNYINIKLENQITIG